MDECDACEEHAGSTDWVLSDKEPELAELGMEALGSRRGVLPETAPTPFPASIINLQNAPNVPPPAGLADDSAPCKTPRPSATWRVSGTQANARAAMEVSANLANQFGARAVELRKAELAAKLAKEKPRSSRRRMAPARSTMLSAGGRHSGRSTPWLAPARPR